MNCLLAIAEGADPTGLFGAARDCVLGYALPKLGGGAYNYIRYGSLPNINSVEPIPAIWGVSQSAIECAGKHIAKHLLGGRVTKIINIGVQCGLKPLAAWANSCPNNDNSAHNTVTPVRSYDPNEIYGYTAESGSKAMKEDLTDVYYTIQFENDTAFATAAAHNIYLADTLETTKFDLSTFRPTRVKIGEKSADLTGDKNFVTTVDMRPEINAIAQVEGKFDQSKGIARWHITSLDPMTMEPTDDVMQGVLPVNTNGNGIGEVSYNISLRPGLLHGTEISNRAGIVFDSNDVIMTPTWTNVIDRIAPESHVSDVQMLNDSTASVSIEASDELSGPWRYDVYVQYGSGAWFKVAENVAADTVASVRIYDGINHGFCVLATDSAGNIEQKQMAREYTLVKGVEMGDANADGFIDTQDAIQVIHHYLGMSPSGFVRETADVNKDGVVDTQDAIQIIGIYLNKKKSIKSKMHER